MGEGEDERRRSGALISEHRRPSRLGIRASWMFNQEPTKAGSRKETSGGGDSAREDEERRRDSRCARIGVHACIGACSYIQACIREKENEGENERTPCRFLLRLIHLHYSIERGKRERARKKERKKWRERERSATHIHRPRNCLRFCFTSRGYLSIAFIDFSHSCFLRCPHGPGLHLYLHRQERDGREAVRERTQSGLKSSCAPRCAIIAYGCYNSNLCLQRTA